MTMPLLAPQQPQQPTPIQSYVQQQNALRQQQNQSALPFWKQAEQAQNQAQQQSTPSVTTPQPSQPASAWSNRLTTTQQAGQIALQGVQGSVATQAQIKAQNDLNKWKAQQQTSYNNLQKQYQQMMAQMQAGYATQSGPPQKGQAAGTTGNFSGGTSTLDFGSTQDNQIAAWAAKAGWSPQDIPMVVAIAHAESGGDPTATHGNNNGSTDFGLMQDNTIHAGDPVMSQFPGFFTSGGWKDPVANLTVAKAIFDDAGGNWGPWSTFTNGAYQQFLKQPKTVASFSVAPTQVGGGVVNTGSTGLRNQMISTAMNYLGTPYVFAGDSLTKGVDCSGLVHEIYHMFNLAVPRTADEDSHPEGWSGDAYGGKAITGQRTSLNNLQPGDLICWQGGWRGPNLVGHVALYAGNGQIIESPDVGLTVRRRNLTSNDYNSGRLIGIHVNIP